MAKIRGGLFSLGASGKLAKTLVYSKWKSEPYAREYVTPANPRTAAQTAQREAMRQAIEYWQLPQLAVAIREGYNRAAGQVGTAISGANVATRNWLALRKAQAAGNIALTGITLYIGNTPAEMTPVSGVSATGDIGMALGVAYNAETSAISITTARNNEGAIVANGTLTMSHDISAYRYVQVRGVLTDNTATLDLTGIVDRTAL